MSSSIAIYELRGEEVSYEFTQKTELQFVTCQLKPSVITGSAMASRLLPGFLVALLGAGVILLWSGDREKRVKRAKNGKTSLMSDNMRIEEFFCHQADLVFSAT